MAALVLSSAPFLMGTTGLRTNFDERLLAAHNRERSAAGVPNLAWSPALADSARKWAEHLQRLDTIRHYSVDPADPDPEGENLWAGTRGHYAPEQMVGLWTSGKKHYRPGTFPAVSRTGRAEDIGHYTQVMWRSSTHVGCALAAARKHDILVCRYTEGGNVIGERPF